MTTKPWKYTKDPSQQLCVIDEEPVVDGDRFALLFLTPEGKIWPATGTWVWPDDATPGWMIKEFIKPQPKPISGEGIVAYRRLDGDEDPTETGAELTEILNKCPTLKAAQ